MELAVGDIISGGGVSIFAYVIWQEVKLMRTLLTTVGERLTLLEERSRLGCEVCAECEGEYEENVSI